MDHDLRDEPVHILQLGVHIRYTSALKTDVSENCVIDVFLITIIKDIKSI